MDADKVAVVATWPTSQLPRALRGFLGLADYYRKFIREFGLIAAPLTRLLRCNAFAWDTDAAEAFQTLKQALTTGPVLQMPDFDRLFMVQDPSLSSVDRSLHAITSSLLTNGSSSGWCRRCVTGGHICGGGRFLSAQITTASSSCLTSDFPPFHGSSGSTSSLDLTSSSNTGRAASTPWRMRCAAATPIMLQAPVIPRGLHSAPAPDPCSPSWTTSAEPQRPRRTHSCFDSSSRRACCLRRGAWTTTCSSTGDASLCRTTATFITIVCSSHTRPTTRGCGRRFTAFAPTSSSLVTVRWCRIGCGPA